MGAWGYGLFEDDHALDIRGEFEDILKEGQTVATATHRILKEYGEMYEEDEDYGSVVILVLAALQMEYSALEPDMKSKALHIIDTGQGLELWEDAGEEALSERKKVLSELREQLVTYTSHSVRGFILRLLRRFRRGRF